MKTTPSRARPVARTGTGSWQRSCLMLAITTSLTVAYAENWPTESIGAGSVSLEAVGSQPFDWSPPVQRSTRKPPEPFITDNLTGPIPTNDWASSVIMDQYSKALYAHPLSFRATSEGMEISQPPETIGSVDSMGETSVRRMHEGNVDLVVKPSGFAPVDARADKVSDWTYDIRMSDGGSRQMTATIGHGLPYAFFEFSGAEPVVALKRGTQMDVVRQDGHALHIRVLDPVTFEFNHYGLFAPEGAQWSVNATDIAVDLPAGRDYFSVAGLPDAQEATFNTFKDRAYNFVTDSVVDWSVNDLTGQVVTTYSLVTQAKPESATGGSIMALYPHQWRYLTEQTTFADYDSIRGTMKAVTGSSFTTVMDYPGILPRMPDLPDSTAMADVKQHLIDYYGYGSNLEPAFIQPGVDGGNTGYDTYWLGKNLNRLSGLVGIADMLDDEDAEVGEMTDEMFSALKGQLEYWFTADKDSPDNYFYYNEDYGTLVGYPSSYGSDNDLNDHHFHYGYWINAAAQIALRDKTWAEDDNWGGMVKELINDIAGLDRNSERYPFLRNFDLYAGHSWASGTVPHLPDDLWAGGNNSEASSEAINAWAGLILWGEATGDKATRDLGIYLYTHEIEAANSYWFNLYDDFGRADYPNIEASRIWGGGYDHSTWWTQDPIQTHGINMLPITGASMYLGRDTEFVQDNFNAIWNEYALWDGDGGTFNPLVVKDRWQDILSEYLAFADPEAALERWKSTNQADDPANGVDPALGIEFGESRAHTLHHMKSLQLLGQPDYSVRPIGHALGVVFNNNGTKTYVAYNPLDTEQTLAFSDGWGILVAANSMGQGPGFPVDLVTDSDGDGVSDDDDLCPDTPPGLNVDERGCRLITDDDNDGVTDDIDQCLNTPPGNTVDEFGCTMILDDDGDGVPNEDDACPYTPEGDRVDAEGCTLVDSDNDGVPDVDDLCPGTPVGEAVDAQGCLLVQDADQDGVPDADDLCPGTPAGATVDEEGCEIQPALYGLDEAGDGVTFFVNTTDWAVVHYRINTQGQLNVGMTQTGSRNEWTVSGLSAGDTVSYWFTYNTPTGAIDTETLNHTQSGTGDADGDGVPDAQDLCPGTPAGSTVDSDGCAVITEPDADGDGVPDAEDQCPGTPAGATVDAMGCELVQGLYGLTESGDGVIFYVDTPDWADVHYSINGGGQQNFRMIQTGSGNEWSLTGLNAGDVISYWFTYNDNGAVDTETLTHTLGQNGS